MTKKCPVCFSSMNLSFSEKILRKYEVDYFYCAECGLLQTEKPYWLVEAYSEAISSTDTGLVSRNLSILSRLSLLLSLFFGLNKNYVDVAGGTGLLVRLMRDIGFNFYWKDIYCENVHARGFEFDSNHYPCEAITAFEVLEHIENSVDFIKNELQETGAHTIIFTTELFNGNPPKPDQWSYYSFLTGQHISFYQRRTLLYIANRLEMRLYSYKKLHMMSKRKYFSPIIYRLIVGPFIHRLAFLLPILMSSKTLDDYYMLTNRSSEE